VADAEIADLVRLERVDVAAVERDPAGARDLDARDRANQRRLAGAVRAHDRDDRAARHRERDARQRLRVPVEQVDVLDGERRAAGHISVSSPR
jgi:hypothetical protein